MTELPKLYTLRQVAEAMQCSQDTVWRALRAHPTIRPIGRGRGTRLTMEDYLALVEAMRGPGPGYIATIPGERFPDPKDKNALRAYRTRQTRTLLKGIRATWKGKS